jgi:hypothetical protein
MFRARGISSLNSKRVRDTLREITSLVYGRTLVNTAGSIWNTGGGYEAAMRALMGNFDAID